MKYTEEVKKYLGMPDDELVKLADRVCRENHGDSVYIRGLIEFSNHCTMNCQYCGIRRDNRNVARYRLTGDEIFDTVRKGHEYGIKTFVLQSGEDPHFTTDVLCGIVAGIKKITGAESAVTLSCGVRSRKDFQSLKDAGCDRYLMRFETSDEEVYNKIRCGLELGDRLDALRNIKDLGFETGSGFMLGLPGEKPDTLADNIALCRELGLDMVGIGPFIPHHETPLADSESRGTMRDTVRAVAVLRIMLPKSNMPATTAAGSIDSLGREKMLAAGANVLMPNITPVDHKKDYLLYPGKICLDESGFECLGCLNGRVASIGKKIDMGVGESLFWKERAC